MMCVKKKGKVVSCDSQLAIVTPLVLPITIILYFSGSERSVLEPLLVSDACFAILFEGSRYRTKLCVFQILFRFILSSTLL